jgi:NAD(P)-dependent dehydrogenase (short-subunit alcohol dehydrogenase family)
MTKLKDKTALVTGSSRGLGREIALRLAQDGADVIICYHSQKEEADQVVQEVEDMGRKALSLQVDLNGTADIARFVDEVKVAVKKLSTRAKLDILINNAGVERKSPLGDVSEEDFDFVFNTNVKGVFFLTQSLLPVLADGGRILMVGTGLTRFSLPPYITYAATKAAVTSFATYMAKTLGTRQITVNTLAPGAIYTDFNRDFFDHNPQVVDLINQNTALGRVGQVDDIGAVAAFLCSEEAKWITGQRLEVSGGMWL